VRGASRTAQSPFTSQAGEETEPLHRKRFANAGVAPGATRCGRAIQHSLCLRSVRKPLCDV